SARIEVIHSNDTKVDSDSLQLDAHTSQKLFLRTGEILQINVTINEQMLRN
ncbi:MAG: hypothetical protein RL108_1869, partial [Bacteroidota bacterium]